ncbi:MAG: hypothetical protein HY246_23950 [Proteobacteria bacterium]|nr:hypothetical protein [Pseudomonadota bacterium]
MPYVGVDSWRWQYFENTPCPAGLVVPVDDATAWGLYPRHRWIYNKLLICATQGLPHGPHGTTPPGFPVFSKPIVNLRGMGTGSRIIATAAEYEATLTPGHLWMKLLSGAHVSTDVAVLAGRPRWWRHTTGRPGADGMFDYWKVHAARRPRLDSYLGDWIRKNLKGFTGVINFETIGGRIIECHLRMAEQWLDLNGPGWLDAVVRLYAEKEWEFRHRPRTGYSVVLFGAHGIRWRIDRAAVAAFLSHPQVSSIQITFDDDEPPESHAMPPGGFRLAIVNCWDLDVGRAVRAALRRQFRAAVGGSDRPPARAQRLVNPFLTEQKP